MILIILILTFLFFSNSVSAQDFSLYADNPVLKKDSQSAGVFQPHVIFKNNVYTAWFADSDGNKASIATMKSANGIDWYEKKTLNLSSRNSVHDPFMLETNNIYKLYFASSDYGDISIWESDSPDGTTYQIGNEKQILTAEGGWEGSSLSCPSVIQDESLRYMVYAGNGGGWAIGLATSTDGINWNKCENNPIIAEGSGPQIVKFNNAFNLYYQSPTGLQVLRADRLDGCDTIWTDKHSISPPFGDPAPVVVGDDIWLYGTYGTLDGPGIGLAGTLSIPRPNYPIILIPGMFASWNEHALLHNGYVAYAEWKLNKNISEYDAFIQTLENKGRILDKDLYVFPYDWRRPIDETVQNLDAFLKDKIWKTNPYQPIQIVGHSLGGVVSRAFENSHPQARIKQVVTAGSPHLGLVQAYKPLAGGELERENSLMWMAEKIVLFLNRSLLQADRDTYLQQFPVLKDLLPTFPYLKTVGGDFVTSAMPYPLPTQFPSPTHLSLFIGASGRQTLGGYILGNRTALDKLSGNYIDGHPSSSWSEDGDEIALLKSSLNQLSPPPQVNHGELIYSKEQIKLIISKLGIEVQDNEIIQGRGTVISPSLLIFVQSPASIQVIHNGLITEGSDGMIHIQNGVNGNYTLKVTGRETGTYTVHIWLIGNTNDEWRSYTKQTNMGKVDSYTITFDTNAGGIIQELIEPTPTQIMLPTPTPKPTIKPSIRPTHKPKPTHKPTPKRRYKPLAITMKFNIILNRMIHTFLEVLHNNQ